MDRAINLLLRTGPFHDALRAVIRARGLTLDRVCKRLADRGCSIGLSTLSAWQHGNTRPASPQAVHTLEEVLGLPPSALTDLIPRTDLSEHLGPLGELLDDFPGARARNVDLVSQHDKVVVDAERRSSRIWSRIVLRARRDGVDRYVMRYFADPGADLDRIVFQALANCRLGSVHRHPHAPVIVAELHFGHTLRAGESWVFERAIIDPTGPPTTVHGHAVRHRVEQYLLQIDFSPGTRPVDIHAFTQTDLDEPKRRVVDLTLNSHDSVHLLGTPLITGVHGIEWSW